MDDYRGGGADLYPVVFTLYLVVPALYPVVPALYPAIPDFYHRRSRPLPRHSRESGNPEGARAAGGFARLARLRADAG